MNAVEYCLLHGLKTAGPEHPALLSAGEVLSYGALAARVSQFAAGLRDAGVQPQDRVGLLMLDTPDIVAMHLAAMAPTAMVARCIATMSGVSSISMPTRSPGQTPASRSPTANWLTRCSSAP